MVQLTDEDFASIGVDFGICLPFVRRIFVVGTHDVNKQSLFLIIGVSILILICSSENYELDSALVCFGFSFSNPSFGNEPHNGCRNRKFKGTERRDFLGAQLLSL